MLADLVCSSFATCLIARFGRTVAPGYRTLKNTDLQVNNAHRSTLDREIGFVVQPIDVAEHFLNVNRAAVGSRSDHDGDFPALQRGSLKLLQRVIWTLLSEKFWTLMSIQVSS